MNLTSASYTSAIMNVVPAVTFVIAVVLRLERLKMKELRSQAKVIGTLVTFAGALIMTMYKGPIINLIRSPKTSYVPSSSHDASSSDNQHWISGTLFILIGCIAWSAFFILQSITIKKYPAVLSLAFLICLTGAVLSAAVTLVGEAHHPDVWSIGWNSRLLAPAYSGVVSSGLTYYLQGLVMKTRGPVFVTAFNPFCVIVVAFLRSIILAEKLHLGSIIGAIILAEKLHLGSIIGAIIIAVGLYAVVWGKGKDQQINSSMPSGELAYELPITKIDGTNLKIPGDNNSTLKHAAGK